MRSAGRGASKGSCDFPDKFKTDVACDLQPLTLTSVEQCWPKQFKPYKLEGTWTIDKFW